MARHDPDKLESDKSNTEAAQSRTRNPIVPISNPSHKTNIQILFTPCKLQTLSILQDEYSTLLYQHGDLACAAPGKMALAQETCFLSGVVFN